MATFIEATETNDEGKRSELVGQILNYNREDLEATWAVFQWLRTKVAAKAATEPGTPGETRSLVAATPQRPFQQRASIPDILLFPHR